MFDFKQWREGTLAAIEKGSPAGSNCRLSEQFDLLQQEVSNDIAVDRQPTDWNKVQQLSNEILSDHSKDFLVLAYNIYALTQCHRYKGLAESLSILGAFVSNYWDIGFPALSRARARAAAFDWLTQKLDIWIDGNEPTEDEFPCVEAIISVIRTVNEQLASKDGDWHLDLAVANQKLKLYLSNRSDHNTLGAGQNDDEGPDSTLTKPNNSASIIPIKPVGSNSETGTLQESINKSPADSTSVQRQVATPPNQTKDIGDEKSFQAELRLAQQQLKMLARYRLVQNIYDPLAYQINRFSTWLPITKLPVQTNQVTPLRPVPIEKRKFFETLYQQQQYEALIIEVENSLSSSPFWLDGHRMVVEALNAIDNKGTNASKLAVDAVTRELRAFIARIAGIEKLSFSDNTPFADENTIEWLDSLTPTSPIARSETPLMLSTESIGRGSLTNGDKPTHSEQDVLSVANDALRQHGFLAGLATLNDHCNAQISRSSWFKGRLMVVQYCVTAKEFLLGEQLLDELDEVAERHQLVTWEPMLVAEMLSTMLSCKSKLKRKQELSKIYSRLACLNVLQGYEMKGVVG